MKERILVLSVVVLMVIVSFGAVGIYSATETEDNCRVCAFENSSERGDDSSGLSSEDIAALQSQAESEGWTFMVGENSATQYSLDDLCGLVVPENWQNNAHFDPYEPTYRYAAQTPPSSFDWRDELGELPPVQNQGACGSCWAFATVGVLECNIKWKDHETVDLSEQYLLSCNTDGYGCNGGWWAHDYHQWKEGSLKDGVGAVMDDVFPYVGWEKSCKSCVHTYKIKDWTFIGSEYGTPSVDKIKQAIMDYGPVSVAVYANTAMQVYTGGIFNGCQGGQPNHAVVLVGWDDNQGGGIWFMRNSWGTSWGEDGGYMRIPYDCSSIGYSACYIEYEPQNMGEHKLDVEIYEITNDPARGEFERIDPPWNKPEWYYRVGLNADGKTIYHYNYNRWSKGFGNWGWNSYYTWQPEENHCFYVNELTPEITIKLMDDDQFFLEGYKDDLADVSQYPGGGERDGAHKENRGAIYHGTYDLRRDLLTGDEVTGPDEEGLYTTIGDGNENAMIRFRITDDYVPEPDLDCSGSLSWTDVAPGSTVTDSFTVKNIGDSYSQLDWIITEKPSWGTWTFTPSNGDDLKPEDGIVTVHVSVKAPDEQEETFDGNIKVVNKEDSSDYCIIPVSLVTPKNNNNMLINPQPGYFYASFTGDSGTPMWFFGDMVLFIFRDIEVTAVSSEADKMEFILVHSKDGEIVRETVTSQDEVFSYNFGRLGIGFYTIIANAYQNGEIVESDTISKIFSL